MVKFYFFCFLYLNFSLANPKFSKVVTSDTVEYGDLDGVHISKWMACEEAYKKALARCFIEGYYIQHRRLSCLKVKGDGIRKYRTAWVYCKK